MKKTKKIAISLLTGICILPNIVNAATAYSIGTKYVYPDEKADTSSLAKEASEAFYSMSYDSYYNTMPTVSYMFGNNPSGKPRLTSEAVFLAGHADQYAMHFNYEHKGGEYDTGVIYTRSTPIEFGLKSYSFPSTRLMVFFGCETGSGDTNNLMTTAISQGVDSSLGWSTKVGTSQASSWFKHLFDYLKQGRTIKEAYDYAQSFNYPLSYNLKNARLWGDWDTGLLIGYPVGKNLVNPKKKVSVTPLDRKEYDINYSLNKSDISVNSSNTHKNSETLVLIEDYIKENFDENFNTNNYILEETDVMDKVYYMFVKTINGARTDEYYQVVLNKDTNTLTQFHESLKKVGDNPSSNPYTINDIENAKNLALSKYNNEIVEQSDLLYYNIEKDTYALYIMTTLKDENEAYYVDTIEI